MSTEESGSGFLGICKSGYSDELPEGNGTIIKVKFIAKMNLGSPPNLDLSLIGLISGDGRTLYNYTITNTTTGVELTEQIPISYQLYQNYPNPFNPTTRIRYQVPERARVTLKVFDILGNEIVKLVDEEKETGIYEVEFNGSGLASGLYFYRIKADDYTDTRKAILVK
jgi:hypothetical protein